MRSLHTEAMCWLRYGKRLPVVATEAGPWNADVLGISPSMAIEVEVKKSRSDLRAEFRNKRAKHFLYANGGESRAFVPNYFYFFVPEALGEYAVQVVNELCPKAGVAAHIDVTTIDGKNTQILKKPIRLREAPPGAEFLRKVLIRMSSQLCGQMIAFDELSDRLRDTVEWARNGPVEAAARAAGALDVEDPEADLKLRAAELAYVVEQIKDFSALPEDQQRKWLEASKRWLEAKYLNAEEWKLAAHRL